MFFDFADAAAGEEEESGFFLEGSEAFLFGRIAIDERMADEFDFEVWFAGRVPGFFEWKDCEHEVDVAGDLVDAGFVPSPDLGGDVIDDFWGPIFARFAAGIQRANFLFERFGEAEIEAGVIDEDDVVGLFLEGEIEELVKEAAEFAVVF